MRIRRLFAMAALAGLGMAFIAVPSQAALTTICDGVASDVTVPGDLVVRAGGSCELTNVTIQGNAIVRRDANLLLDDSRVNGNLIVQANGFADVVGSSVAGRTRLNNSYGVYSENSEHAGTVNANNPEFFYSLGSTHAGNVISTEGETYFESAWLERNLRTTGDVWTDIVDTVVERQVTVSGTEEGSYVCASEVDGNATFTGNSEIVQLGAGDPATECGYSVFGGNLTLGNNTAQVSVDGSVIRGNLNCAGNDPAPVVVNNRIRGSDQCDGATTGAATLSRSAQVDPDDHKAAILAKIEKRTSAAEAGAEKAGRAFGNS